MTIIQAPISGLLRALADVLDGKVQTSNTQPVPDSYDRVGRLARDVKKLGDYLGVDLMMLAVRRNSVPS